MNPDLPPPPGHHPPDEPAPPLNPPVSATDAADDPRQFQAAEVVSIATLFLVALALGAAVLMYFHDGTSIPLVTAIGGLMMKGGTVIDFYLGSSRSSQNKDAVIANQLPPTPPLLPPAPPS